MGTGACILDKESEMPCGLIIEKVNGYAVEKRLTKDETFADVRYILEMCRQVRAGPSRHVCLCSWSTHAPLAYVCNNSWTAVKR